MTITHILFDLDDTLLGNSTQRFLPEYLKLLSHALSRFAAPEAVPMLIMECTADMQTNPDPTVTNFEAFYAPFLARLDVSMETVQPVIDHFYQFEYPSLQQVVEPVAGSRELLQYLFDAGYTVAVATNPLFPRTAVEQRLQWAGVGDFAFELITTMEIMHFSKPNPRYFEEMLVMLNVAPQNALMVGDDPDRDITGAQAAGLHTWHITPPGAENGTHSPLHGTLMDLFEWVKAGNLNTFFGD